MNKSYKSSGVDVEAGYKAVELMKDHINSTKTKGVLGAIGGFGGLFKPDLTGMKNPILVSGTDGVGTKLKLAFLLSKHDTIGQDCVAMCVNDILCSGARPLFFLDYIATSKLVPEQAEQIVKGIAKGCRLSGCALIGGETAEMPGFYEKGEYDVAGFAVGIVDKKKMITSKKIRSGDVLIALPSSGAHSNGFSLLRKVFDVENTDLSRKIDSSKKSLGELLLTPTKIYVKPVVALFDAGIGVHGICHITGGGFYENIPRMLPPDNDAVIEKSLLKIPPIFEAVSQEGGINYDELFGVFNMGVGMLLAVKKSHVTKALDILKRKGEKAYIVGEISDGNGDVKLI